MAKDVLITPANGSIEIKNDADTLKVRIEADTITESDKVLKLPNKTGILAVTTDLPSLEEKEYTNVLITENNEANGYLDFIKVIPNTTTGVWTVKYQFEVTPTIGTNTNYTGVFDCEISAYGTSGNVYKIFNSFNGNITLIYYHVLTFAKTENMATDGHRIGIRLASTSNPTTIARNYTVRIIDTKNCTATLLSSMTLNPYYQTADAVLKAKYQSAWVLNATSNGLQESGDNDATHTIAYPVQPIAGPAGIAYLSIIAENMAGTFESLKTPSSISSSGITLVPNNTKFKLGKPLLWYTGGTKSQGTRGDGWSTFTQQICDVRYISNYYGTSGVTAFGPYNDAWMKVNIDLSDYSFTPQSVVIRASDITTSGYYILIGHAYNAVAYQIVLLPETKIYYYDSTTQVFSLVSLTRDATTTDSGLMSATDKTKLDGIAAGAQVGTVTSITAGTGLTGGTITGSGTLAVSYGTTAGTAAQGNDSRLSDARTPTAHVLNSATHTVSGLTTGHFLKATGATSFGFAAHGLTYSDVNAAPTAGSSSITTLGTIGTGTWQGSIINSTYGGTGVNNGGRTLAVNTNSGTLTFTNASTTLTVANNASVSGTNTGDQSTITGNAGTATTLQTPRTLTIGSTGKTFNGGADVSWSLAEIGAASSSSLSSHTSSTNNPHSVTASQVGLGTTATPTFAGMTLGSSGQTWVIDGSSTSLLMQSGATPTTRLSISNAGEVTIPALAGTGGVLDVDATGKIILHSGSFATEVTLASGTNNGTLKLTVNGSATDNIAVKGLGSAAYTASTAYATSAQGATADTAIQSGSFAGTTFTKTGTALSITQANARSALGLGSAAYTASTDYRGSSWVPTLDNVTDTASITTNGITTSAYNMGTTSATTTKATMQYNATTQSIEFIFA